jgi:hypothetical protein
MYLDDDTHLLVIEGTDPCPTPEADATPDAEVHETAKKMEDAAFEKIPELARETIDDFHARAKECHPLSDKIDVPIKVVLVGSKDLEPLFPKGEFDRAWSRFYAKYPGSSGTITFSNPGFNHDHTQAMIYSGRLCGGLCGAGFLLLLETESGAWKVKSKFGMWVS